MLRHLYQMQYLFDEGLITYTEYFCNEGGGGELAEIGTNDYDRQEPSGRGPQTFQ